MFYSSAVIDALRARRPLLLSGWGSAPVARNKGTAAHDVVTEIDLRVEEELRDALKRIDPSIPFVGEETGGIENVERFWLCDPIDGTAHYVRGLPFATSMVTLIEKGQVNFVAIYDFINDNVYHATRGQGAFRDSEPIRVSTRSLKEGYCIPETKLEKPENYKIYLKLLESAGGLPEFYNCGFDFAMIASGKLDGRICFDSFGKDWDYAPSLLVEEAGGVIANIGMRTYDYRNHDFIAANPIVFKDLTEGPDAPFPIL
jgi:myo-inositol-1(or 4)-monophosphatase